VLVTSGVNPLRRWPAPATVERVLWPKLRMVATIDFRMSTTATRADLFLPAAGYYEKRGIKYAMALLPYLVVGDLAVAPLGESRGEWQIMVELARLVQERARARGVEGPAATLHDRFSENGRLGPDSDVELLDRILRGSKATAGIGWDEARRAGALPLRSAGGWGTTSGVGSEIEPGGTLTPSRIHVEERHAWPTLTGRQQFYLDHPWFEEADEVLPRWKPQPRPGGDHPIQLSGGHTRWSIHAIWRAHPDLLRLQRGEPVLWMSDRDARARGIADGQRVRVWNDHGEFRILAKPTPALAPGLAIVYHAWEPYQFEGRRGNMEVVSSPYKPLHLVGDYGHLRQRVFFSGPVHVPRGVPVEIAPAPDATDAAGRPSAGFAATAGVARSRLAR
jgi:nitrate reductase alpha subunit